MVVAAGALASEDRVRRCAVPGGWLYQVENTMRLVAEGNHSDDSIVTTDVTGWHAPVFVPGVWS